MKKFTNILLALLLIVLAVQPLNLVAEIKLNGRKNMVLSSHSRAEVLEVAHLYLTEKNAVFLNEVAEAETPFAFEQPVETITEDGQPVQEVVVTYDDASVLRVVIKSFSEQVRGTLVRGDTSFLQLKGGSMLKPGASFPVSIPQAQGQTFTVTITDISSDGYTLKVGEASETISLNGGSSGAMKLN